MRQMNKLAAVLLCATLTLSGMVPMRAKAADNPTMQFSTENTKTKERSINLWHILKEKFQ